MPGMMKLSDRLLLGLQHMKSKIPVGIIEARMHEYDFLVVATINLENYSLIIQPDLSKVYN